MYRNELQRNIWWTLRPWRAEHPDTIVWGTAEWVWTQLERSYPKPLRKHGVSLNHRKEERHTHTLSVTIWFIVLDGWRGFIQYNAVFLAIIYFLYHEKLHFEIRVYCIKQTKTVYPQHQLCLFGVQKLGLPSQNEVLRRKQDTYCCS